MTVSYLVSKQDLDHLFEILKKRINKNPDDLVSILEDLQEISLAFTPAEIVQAANFLNMYLEISQLLCSCSSFSRFNAKIMKAIEEIMYPESHGIEIREKTAQSVKYLISIL